MFKIRKYLLIAIIWVVTPLVFASDYVVPNGVTVLTGEQILNQLIGNSIVNETITEYWEPPSSGKRKGNFRAQHVRGKYGGRWEIKGDLFCYDFDEGLYDIYDGSCYTFSLAENTIFFYNPDGSTWYPSGGRLKVVPGNPKNL